MKQTDDGIEAITEGCTVSESMPNWEGVGFGGKPDEKVSLLNSLFNEKNQTNNFRGKSHLMLYLWMAWQWMSELSVMCGKPKVLQRSE